MPSRLHPGKFYALPQAPQQFKQLLMVAGFDRYFQIAPCFRDEDARADRSPGEFYQLDVEMSFVTQEDVFEAIEPVLRGVFEEFADGKPVTQTFPRIPFRDAMLKYGSDKPDLRNPLIIADVSRGVRARGRELQGVQGQDRARHSGAGRGRRSRAASSTSSTTGRARKARRASATSSSRKRAARSSARGRSPSSFPPRRRRPSPRRRGVKAGDAVFFSAGEETAGRQARRHGARLRIGNELGLSKTDVFEFCWIVDFPMYEWNEDDKKIDFSHNPFSMPQGGLEALETKDPLDHSRLSVRHRLQRHRAVVGRDPQPSPRRS